MSCYHPLRAFASGVTKDGKIKYRILPFEVAFIDYRGNPCSGEYSEYRNSPEDIAPAFEVPCGHCIGCRQDQSKEWASRLVMEMQYHDSAYFVTLTYDDFNVPVVEYFDPETGEYDINYSLVKRDVQLFMKRLRSRFHDDRIRFYLAGEYGDTTRRPHYHAILFGLHVTDLVRSGRSETGNIYFTSPVLESVWNKGFVSIEPANYATCKYVASYVTKKIGIRSDQYYHDLGIVPPFSLSSRKPGIGYQYLYDHIDKFYSTDDIRIPMVDGSYKIKVPRYFKKKLQEFDEQRYNDLKTRICAAADDRKELILENTEVDWLTYLEGRENEHKQRIKQRSKV